MHVAFLIMAVDGSVWTVSVLATLQAFKLPLFPDPAC